MDIKNSKHILEATGLLIVALLSAATIASGDEIQRNKTLLSAASPFEDLTEYSLAGNKQGMDSAIKEAEKEIAHVMVFLSPESRERLEALFSNIVLARKKEEFAAAALNSVEAYRVIVGALDAAALKTPLETPLLDYTGFKIQALAKQAPPNWVAIRQTVSEAQRHWSAIEARVADTGLRDVMDTAIEGLMSAAKSKNLEMVRFASQVELDLVDLLEGYFETHAKLSR